MSFQQLDPAEALARQGRGAAVLIDVREPDEMARERIAGARPLPLSTIGSVAPPIPAPEGADLVFFCRTGNRTTIAAPRLAALLPAGSQGYVLGGGLEAWKRAGHAVERTRAPLPLMQQVQITAGSLVVIGVGLGWLVAPAWAGLAAFVGAGLVFAGVTGQCGMARALALMPWNRTLVSR